jgi:hypothetical protein
MGTWGFDPFASDDAYNLLGELDDLLAVRKDWTGLRAALRIVGLPCLGYSSHGEVGGTREPRVSLEAAREALDWLSERVEAARRDVRPGGEARPELEGVAALGAVATLLAVAGPALLLDPTLRERWALWLETAPAVWTHDPRRLDARRQVASALRDGSPISYTTVGGTLVWITVPPITPERTR